MIFHFPFWFSLRFYMYIIWYIAVIKPVAHCCQIDCIRCVSHRPCYRFFFLQWKISWQIRSMHSFSNVGCVVSHKSCTRIIIYRFNYCVCCERNKNPIQFYVSTCIVGSFTRKERMQQKYREEGKRERMVTLLSLFFTSSKMFKDSV